MSRTSAALLITRGSPPDLEVLLCERSAELRFFGGYHAFPGGTLDRADGDGEAGLQQCAHRELFEEIGLLRHAVQGREHGEPLRALREAMLEHAQGGKTEGPSPWHQWAARHPAPPPLRAICRITTPPFALQRYDTLFFHAPLEHCTDGTAGQQPDVWPGELTMARFWQPGAALAAWRRGELLLVPPAVILLGLLEQAIDFERFCAAAAALAGDYAQGRLHRVQFTPGVVLAPLRTPTLPPATTTNCYVVGTDRLWVIDPGSPDPDEQQRLERLLDELTAGGAELAGILSTHHHPDHVGGLAALCRSRQLAVRGHALTLERLPAGCRLGEPLRDGDRIVLGTAPDGAPDWQLVALHTPGHDRGHLCFRETRYDGLIAGDMLSTISTIIVDPPEGHLTTYLQSLERLLCEPLGTLYPAHGPAMRDGHRLIRQYLRHRRQRESSLVEALRKGGGTVEALLPQVYWDADPRLFPFAARSLVAGLQKLAEEGRAVQRGDRWQTT